MISHLPLRKFTTTIKKTYQCIKSDLVIVTGWSLVFIGPWEKPALFITRFATTIEISPFVWSIFHSCSSGRWLAAVTIYNVIILANSSTYSLRLLGIIQTDSWGLIATQNWLIYESFWVGRFNFIKLLPKLSNRILYLDWLWQMMD